MLRGIGPSLERRILEVGRKVLGEANGYARRQPGQWIDNGLLSLSRRDRRLKTQLFRFIDVLPALSGSAQIAGHLREYLTEAGEQLPAPLGGVARHIPDDGLGGPVIAWLAGQVVRRTARRFIAAGSLDEAFDAIVRLRRRRLACTLDLLGEAVVSEAEAKEYQNQYLRLLEALPRRMAELPFDPLLDSDGVSRIPSLNLSIKLSALYSQFDPIDPAGTTAAVCERLRPILRAARAAGAFINFDMEQFAFKDATLHVFKTVFEEEEFRGWGDVGIAIQAYLRSSAEDLRDLAAWAQRRGRNVWVRLVKGAYWDYETIIARLNSWPVPVYARQAETDANFEACARFLIENHRLLRPAIASHNVRSLSAAMGMAEKAGLGRGQIEFQMLHGMADDIKSALVAMGRRVRVYAPVGQLLPGMAYLVRRLLENSSNESFLGRRSFKFDSYEKLLMNPLQLIGSPRQRTCEAARFVNEAPSDFSRADARETMAAAVRDRAARAPERYPLVIGGRRVETYRWMPSKNPSHRRQVLGEVAAGGPEEAGQAVAAAAGAFATWRETPAEERAELLEKVGGILSSRRFELAAMEVYECGKPWREADSDVAEAIDYCRYYAAQMRLLIRGDGVDIGGESNRWLQEPRGVAVVIAPWNFPLAILCGMTSAAVVSGNPVVMKPAEQSSLVAAMLMQAFEDAGCPAGVVNFLPGIGEEVGPALVGHPEVAIIAFTGSRAVGLEINRLGAAAAPGQRLVKRVITEMGGKNAIIIDEDADLDEAVTGVVASAFDYAGQKCSACSRAVVLEGIYETFLRRLVEATASLKIAPAEDPACRIGPVIDAAALARIGAMIEQGSRQAKLAYAGDVGALADEGFFVGPHIFVDMPPGSALAQEEIFGPVLSVMKARGMSEALQIANGTSYALTGGLYSRSPENIRRCRQDFRVGNLYINRKITGAMVGRQPFGGFKLSGGGTQAGGPDYLRQFLLPRCVTENTMRHGFVPSP